MDDNVNEYYKDKVILITGGGGSIGSEICRQLVKAGPEKIILLDIYENSVYQLYQELMLDHSVSNIFIEIASITNKGEMNEVFRKYHPQIVIHAAAHKHVPLMENNPVEAVYNNVFGTKNVVDLCEEYGAEHFMLISTDKAINPTSVMGATKRMCEMLVMARSVSGNVKYSMNRFGNVLGSAGSVVPIFKMQIERGGPVRVTDKRVTRFFMTISEACQLVLESGSISKNGELFVLDMGRPVKIYDLAQKMIELSGREDIEIIETGLRPAEKLYEEILVDSNLLGKTANPLIFVEHEKPLSEEEIDEKLRILDAACASMDDDVMREAIKETVDTYCPEKAGNTELVRGDAAAADAAAGKRSIPFSPPDITYAEICEVVDTLKSGWITTGPKTKRFEELISGYVGTQRTVCLASQTASAETALRILGIGPGDEVITCAYTYTATASVVTHTGAKLVLVDCMKDSPAIDPDALERAITERTKAVIPVDIAGIPCDYDRIFEIVERKKDLFTAGGTTEPGRRIQKALGRIAVIADAAHALGASYKGKMAGSIADFTNYSFHAVKNLTTAEGGAMTWRTIEGIDDGEIYRLAQLYSLHGQSKDALSKFSNGTWEYDIAGPWYKCNMTDIAASIGLAQLSRYPSLLKRRKEIINRYDKALLPVGVRALDHFTEDHESSGHLYITRIPGITPEQRDEIIEKMAERGIAVNVHYKPLPMHTAYMDMGFDIGNYPNSFACFANSITLPLYTKLTDDDVDYIIENYCDILSAYIR